MAKKISWIKRNTGQHPGGVFIIPKGKEICDYTPIQHPVDIPYSETITTYFDYHSLPNLLKVDVLAHDTPSMLHKLEQLTGVNPQTTPLGDKETMKLFAEGRTCGVPEFYTEFVRNMMKITGVNSFDDLIRISGLSHGTDVWLGNGEYAIEDGVKLSDLISPRDDIAIYLERCGYDRREAFKIAERVKSCKIK